MSIAYYSAQIERLEYFYQISVTRDIFLFAVTEYHQLNFFIAAVPLIPSMVDCLANFDIGGYSKVVQKIGNQIPISLTSLKILTLVRNSFLPLVALKRQH